MGEIIWLASYPKSGNTWFRVFLTNLRGGLERPARINELGIDFIANSRTAFDNLVGIESSDLTPAEIDLLRPEAYKLLAAESEELTYVKAHDAFRFVRAGLPLFPTQVTRCAIYLVRSPLDVAVSFSHHMGCDVETTILRMASDSCTLSGEPGRLNSQLRQLLSSWSGHVSSWVDASKLPVCVLRYEDMKQKPLETFERAVKAMGLDYGRQEIIKALELSSFEELQRQEKEAGFRERGPGAKTFFRKGEVGSWRDELTEDQARRIVESHREVMLRFGYLDTNDRVCS